MISVSYFIWPAIAAALTLCSCLLAGNPRGAAPLAVLAFILMLAVSCIFMPAASPFVASGFLMALLAFAMAGFASATGGGPMGLVANFVGAALLSVFAFLSTFSGFHAASYAALVSPVQAARDASMPLTDQTQARLVTHHLAEKRAAELLSSSSEQGIGSRVEVGEMWGSSVNGRLHWIAPLEHSGFFRWLGFDTTPGYVMVSQFNELDSRLVEGKPIRIGRNAWFGDNLTRLLYAEGFVNYAYGDPVFQVDGDGTPHWVVAMLQPQVGISGYMPVKWAVVDAGSGRVEAFTSAQDLPEWVDRAYPQSVIAARFDDWGCLGQGWMACWFTGQNTIRSTPGISVTISPEGRIVYYSGTQFVTSSADGATSGVYIADARTGEIAFYARAGITETAAQQVMTQAWANYDGYRAQSPLLITVDGSEAYFSVVTDASGARKGFAIVAQDNRNILGTGTSVQAAVTDWSRSMQRAGRDRALEPGQGLSSETFEGIVETHQAVTQGGRTAFYITVDTLPGKILEFSDERIGTIVATKVGDPVRVASDNFAPGVVFLTSFENLRFTLDEGGLQPEVDRAAGTAMERYREASERRNAEALVESLDPAELEGLLRALRSEKAPSD